MILFISDLHLCPERPATTAAFSELLNSLTPDTSSLWILGDLFEYWAGDDDIDSPFHAQIASSLRRLVETGVDVRLIIGNRDFLLAEGFAKRTGVTIVQEPAVITLGQHKVLLMHGDALCTDDHAYQQFRTMTRAPAWQQQFLAQPLAVRHQIAADMRAKSESAKQDKTMDIMDVNADAVDRAFADAGADWLIHGHTHRPATHTHQGDKQRFVLPDWHDRACGLRWDGAMLQPF